MSINRRQFLTGAAATVAGLALTGCHTVEQALTHSDLGAHPLPPAGEHEAAVRLLNRVAFGPRPGDVAEVLRLGVPAYIDRQLSPDSIAEPDVLTWRIHALGDVLNADTSLLFDEDDRRLVAAQRQARTLRAVYSNRQLFERMVEFWSDHFNIYAFKGQGAQLTVGDDHETIRKHALGNFGEMLIASARSAAMLGYLDNNINRRGVPNENYAREVMELHSLGIQAEHQFNVVRGSIGSTLSTVDVAGSHIDAYYTQDDVRELARCLTGWTSEKHWHRGRFLFDSSAHDTGAKSVLGMSIPAGGGVDDAESVLKMLAVHPATARHLSTKLCHYFTGDTSDALVAQASKVYLQTSGDIKSVMRTILMSSEIQSGSAILKRPFDYIVSGLRALNADTDGGTGIQDHLQKMGQPLFGWPMPNGYPTDAKSWTGGLIPRWNFALALMGDWVDGTKVDVDALVKRGRELAMNAEDTIAELVFSRPSSDPLVQSVRRRVESAANTREFTSLMLMSPEFQWR